MLKRFFKRSDNPWEVLVLGALVSVAGLFLLFRRGPLVPGQQQADYRYLWFARSSGVIVISEHGAHILGGLAIGVGVALLWLYVYLRRELARTHVVEHGHERI